MSLRCLQFTANVPQKLTLLDLCGALRPNELWQESVRIKGVRVGKMLWVAVHRYEMNLNTDICWEHLAVGWR